jgi:hypothetical protein
MPDAGEKFLPCANHNRFFHDAVLGGNLFSPIKSGIFARFRAVKFRLALPLLNASRRRRAPAQVRRGPNTLQKI